MENDISGLRNLLDDFRSGTAVDLSQTEDVMGFWAQSWNWHDALQEVANPLVQRVVAWMLEGEACRIA